jgi:hypothetical protein
LIFFFFWGCSVGSKFSGKCQFLLIVKIIERRIL